LCDVGRVAVNDCFKLLSFFYIYFIINIDFTRIAALNTATDDVTN